MAIKINTPLTREKVKDLKAGDSCLISGVIYTARDAAHKRLCELVDAGKELPLDVKDAIIYFVGPTPAKPGQAIGSAGNTGASEALDGAHLHFEVLKDAKPVNPQTYLGNFTK